MAYIKTNWVNDGVPAINATNLNNIEEGIYQAHQNTGELSDLETDEKTNLVKAINEINAFRNKISNIQNDSQTDVYSCDYINKLNTYSTEEHVIGTYMDKPLYRKTFASNLVEGNNEIIHNIENINHIFVCDKSYIYTNGSHYPANYVNSSDNLDKQYIKTSANTTTIDIFLGGYMISGTTNCAITLEYTKTTD